MTEQFDYLCAPYAPIDEHSEYAQPINEDCSSGVVPQDATVIGTLTEDGKRKILVSEVAIINKPFFDRNRSMMTRYINEQLRDGSMRFIVPFAFTTRHAYPVNGNMIPITLAMSGQTASSAKKGNTDT